MYICTLLYIYDDLYVYKVYIYTHVCVQIKYILCTHHFIRLMYSKGHPSFSRSKMSGTKWNWELHTTSTLGCSWGDFYHGTMVTSSINRDRPLVNVYITMENHHFSMGQSTISMAIFNSYASLPEGKPHKNGCCI